MITQDPESVRPLSTKDNERNDKCRFFGDKCELKEKGSVRIMF